jgi:hypothetical protein
MTKMLKLSPLVVVSPTNLGVSVVTSGGATVHVLLPKPPVVNELPHDEVVRQAKSLARIALDQASFGLADC